MPRFAIFAALFLTLTYGCGKSEKPSDPDADLANGLSPTSPNLVYADGWSEIKFKAVNFADTTFDIAGHFSTSRNACGKEQYGVVDLRTWNGIAKDANLVVKAQPLLDSAMYCVDTPDGMKVDGTVELTMTSGKRVLYEYRGGQICSSIADHALSDGLLQLLNTVVIAADREDCPNGWGSG